jgi:hypothetical protein
MGDLVGGSKYLGKQHKGLLVSILKGKQFSLMMCGTFNHM